MPKRKRANITENEDDEAENEMIDDQAEEEDVEDLQADEEEEDMEVEEEEEENAESQREKDERNKQVLVKRVAHCILSSCSKRGQCRDADIAEMFTDREERDLRKKVLERTEKKLKQILGIKMERDEGGKRYYLYNDLKNDIEMKLAERFDDETVPDHESEGDEENANDNGDGDDSNLENHNIRRWLLTSTLMFIYMSKRHTELTSQTDKGIDWLNIKNFLNNLFERFDKDPLTEKQYGELFGPSKSAEFISQGWLRCDIHHDQMAGIQEVFYFWGPRAETVISKQEMLQEFCKIYGGTIKDWPNHAKAAGFRHIH